MKYRNAADVLPETLLREVRKYAAGELLYVPGEERKRWGQASGARALRGYHPADPVQIKNVSEFEVFVLCRKEGNVTAQCVK